MKLPKINHTSFKHFLVGLNKEVRFRAFTNAEQKTLLLAKDQKDDKRSVIDAVAQIVGACTFGTVDVEKLSTFDLEDLFLRIRSKSVSEVSDLRYRYDYTDENDKPVSEFIDFKLNLDEVKVQTNPDHCNKFMLDDTLGIKMQYPTFALASVTDESEIIKHCIECIFDTEGNVYYLSDYSNEEVESFMSDIDMQGMLKIKAFFDTMPKLEHTITIKTKTGKTITETLSGIQSFF